MQKSREILVYPTGRIIRDIEVRSPDGILPKMVTMGEFLESIIVIDGYSKIGEIEKLLLMRKALECANIEKLGFSKNFLDYLEHSSFLFSFFDELANEQIRIADISREDTYAEYDEHLQILEEVYKNYLQGVQELGFYDKTSFAPWEINLLYLQDIERIKIYIDGFLNGFEFEVLDALTKYVQVEMYVDIDEQNFEYYGRRLPQYGIEIEEEARYRIDFGAKSFHLEPMTKIRDNTKIYPMPTRVAQVDFLFAIIEEKIDSGVAPENIVVVLPDESLKRILMLFDKSRNLNYAMGHTIGETPFYRDLEILFASLGDEREKELAFYGLKEKQIELLAVLEAKNCDALLKFLANFKRTKEIQEQVEAELFKLRSALKYIDTIAPKELFALFLKGIKGQSYDDVGGGKVKVMGLLECRGGTFDVSIILDFSDTYVPYVNDSDLFLNTKIRERLSLPTKKDRERLQKGYYKKLIESSKECFISYVENDSSEISKFAYQLGLKSEISKIEKTIFPPKGRVKIWDGEFVEEYDYTKERFSYSKIRTFLDCKRKFFYRYLKKIKRKDERNPKREAGILLHAILKNVYEKDFKYDSVEGLKNAFKGELAKRKIDDIRLQVEVDYFLHESEKFFRNEIERFDKGVEIVALEDNFKLELFGVEMEGYIDRIDRVGELIEVIDYKYKNSIPKERADKLDKNADFQLLIYAEALKKKGVLVAGAYLYDLKSGVLIEDQFLDRKREIFEEKLEMIKGETIEFSKQEDDPKVCQYCDYKNMCGR